MKHYGDHLQTERRGAGHGGYHHLGGSAACTDMSVAGKRAAWMENNPSFFMRLSESLKK
jgi:hypothetical protein